MPVLRMSVPGGCTRVARHAAATLCVVAAVITTAACSNGGSSSASAANTVTGSVTASVSSTPSRPAGTSLAKPVPTRTVAAPSPGDVHQTVASAAPRTLAAVPLIGRSALGSGIVVSITSVRAITTKTSLPGQVGGASIAVSVLIVNHSDHAIGVQNVNVNVEDSAHDPADPITTSPARAFRGSIAAGKKASAMYVYSISTTRRNPITVEINYAAGTPVARFIGGVK